MSPRLKLLLQRPRVLLGMLVRKCHPESKCCPSCGGEPLPGTLDRRYGVMTLGRCSDCLLLFRSPTDTPIQSFTFYQKDYTEESVTELPNLRQLAELKAAGFSSKGDLTPYLTVMKQFYGDRGSKLVDYGCSWGYNTWRFQSEGFVASGVEVSKTRCDYGKKELGVDLHYSADQLPSDFDIFFSSHVFEHVPSPANPTSAVRCENHLILPL